MRIKFLLFLLCSCPAFAANLSIQVENILPKQGKIYVGVFDRENYIHKGRATRDTFVNANHVSMVVAFDNIPAGVYSVRIYQDVNNNGILDTGLFGLPIEKCGFSNNTFLLWVEIPVLRKQDSSFLRLIQYISN